MCWNWLFHTEMIFLVTILKMRRKWHHLIVSLLTIRWYQLFYWMKQSRKYKRMKTKGKQNEFKMVYTFKAIYRTFYLLKTRKFSMPFNFHEHQIYFPTVQLWSQKDKMLPSTLCTQQIQGRYESSLKLDKTTYLLSFPTTSKNPTSGDTSCLCFPWATCLVYAINWSFSL